MQFCLAGNNNQGIVKYDVFLNEEWEVNEEPYNLYTMDNHIEDGKDSARSVIIPLTTELVLTLLFRAEIEGFFIKQEGIRRNPSFVRKPLHISVFNGAVIVLVFALVLFVIDLVWLVYECYQKKERENYKKM